MTSIGPSDELLDSGRLAWPDLPLAPAIFAAYLAERPDARAAHAGDLYLACACLADVPGAAAHFTTTFLAPVDAYVRRVAPERELADEVRQRLAERLLVQRRLADYGGHGALAAWVRVSAVRLAIDLRRGVRADHETLDDAVLAAPPGDDPALDYLRARYGPALRAAVQDALAALDARTRTLLHLHLVSGLSTRELARLQHVNQSTIVRRLDAVRAEVREAVRARLAAELGIGAAELESLAGVVMSGVDLSLGRVLGA